MERGGGKAKSRVPGMRDIMNSQHMGDSDKGRGLDKSWRRSRTRRWEWSAKKRRSQIRCRTSPNRSTGLKKPSLANVRGTPPISNKMTIQNTQYADKTSRVSI